MDTRFTLNEKFLSELKNKQTLLGCTDLKSAANLLMTLGALVIDEALKGGEVAIVFSEKAEWNPISHPALEHIKTIRAEKE